MTKPEMDVNDTELHAYVDDQLAAKRRAEVEVWLAAHPEAQERVQAWRLQNQAMQSLFNPLLDEPIPVTLQNALARKPAPALWRVAAALAWVAVGAVLGFALNNRAPETVALVPLAERAAVAHVVFAPEILHPVEVLASQEKHLVQWLSKRLGKELRTPDFAPLGFQLIGGRLLPGDKGPAAQFMYQDALGARLTLYVSNTVPGTTTSAFRFQDESDTRVLYWVDGDLGFALVGNLERPQLLALAHSTYQAFNF